MSDRQDKGKGRGRDGYEDFDLPEIDYSEYTEGLPDEDYDEDRLLTDLTASLGHQVSEELGEEEHYTNEDEEALGEMKKKKKKHKVLKVAGIFLGIIVLFAMWAGLTPSGRRWATGIAAKWLHSRMDVVDNDNKLDENGVPIATQDPENTPTPNVYDKTEHRHEDYVTSFLIFGIEEIYGASNTDAMMLVSVNTKDNTIKLTSFLRDTLVTIPGYKRNKLNSVYSRGGADLLVQVIEDTYDVEIDGYASVNFESFEAIIDRLGGIDIELGESEASYLRRKNYISDVSQRTVVAGWNHLTGNQALGYVRVRKVATLGGATDDYGRTLRQRRVINAVITKFKSSSVFDMLPIISDCLGHVKTNISEQQLADLLADVVENGIYTTDSMRLPTEDYFYDSQKAGIDGVTYALVIDDYVDINIKLFHQFLFLDEEPTEVVTPGAEDGQSLNSDAQPTGTQ